MAADSRALRSLAELDAALDGRPMVLFLGMLVLHPAVVLASFLRFIVFIIIA